MAFVSGFLVASETATSSMPDPKPPGLSKTRKALDEQRVLVDSLRSTADKLEKDAEEIHGEICP